ncbi:unnamed protein product [Caenorhabditis angaria]|uniref:G-protein coupled receptors family 1 profile domain-containing protein n=1 Tax=Caenorhabditis angaria TaxID=860376 RepID=A0A9P1J0K5_9PELO|nr:unnamed protein product [Caenorhabditis angaria]
MAEDCEYFGCYILVFAAYYDEVHIPLSIGICLFGAASNVFNIIVLTRKRMRTPINVLFTGLSAAQWLLATNYLLFLILEYYRMQCVSFLWSKSFTYYRFLNVNLNTVFHTIAFATTIALAIFRYCALKFPIRANRFIYKVKPAVAVNIFIWFIVPIISLPVFFISEVKELDGEQLQYNMNCSMSGPLYDLSYQGNPTMVSAVFWTFGIVFKLLPSIILAVMTIGLIRSLKSVERRRTHWKRNQGGAQFCTSSERKAKKKLTTRPRTTRMLVIILSLCLSVEFPMGILNLCVAIFGEHFGEVVYDPLGNLMEMLTLSYSCVSFVLYCLMSNDFLSTFRALFCPWAEKNPFPLTVGGSWKGRRDDDQKSPRSCLINYTGPNSYVGTTTPVPPL